MKNKFFITTVLVTILLASCKKGGGNNPPPQPPPPAAETPVAFTVNAGNGSISPGSSFPVTVTLSSAMPSAKGISLVAIVTDQTDNSALTQNAAITSNSAVNTVTLINLPQQHWCNVSIKVASVATPNNSATQNFTVVYK